MNSPVWPHSQIKEIFPNIYFVTGTNITSHDNVKLQHSRNMVIIRDNNQLSLINTVRLNNKGLVELDSLGKVVNVIRIGAFHGRDDAFYLDHYNAKLWALKGMEHANNKITDIEIVENGEMPVPDCTLFDFKTSIYPEGILHINQQGGILITCDSIKNWVAPDEFFSSETIDLYTKQDFFGTATISNIWQEACKVDKSDFARLKEFKFRHLLSAHGDPLLDDAYEIVAQRIKEKYEI